MRGYYAWCERKPSARQQANTRLLEEIQSLRQEEEVCYGSPRMTEELKGRGHTCSENRIARLMRTHGLRAQAKPRFVPCTTDSDHDQPVAPNRLAERAAPDGPNQVWLQDITYVPTAQGWLFLALVMDLWSRKIVGWAMADHLRSELVVSALQMAQTQPQPGKGLLVHSDRGVQYASKETRDFLEHHGWQASMSRSGNPYDKGKIERAHPYWQGRLPAYFASEKITQIQAANLQIDALRDHRNTQEVHRELRQIPQRAWEQARKEKRSVLRPAPRCPWWDYVWSVRTAIKVGSDGRVPIGTQRLRIEKPPKTNVILCLHPSGHHSVVAAAPDPKQKLVLLFTNRPK